MKPGIFITGTDTDVGKTVISAGIAMMLREKGVKVGVMKPVATGCFQSGKRLTSSDAAFLFEAAENEYTGLTNPSRYKHPVSPNVAAEIEKRDVDIKSIIEAYQELQKHYDFIIVEGVGGLMVPLFEKYYVTDLVREFKLPLLIVAKAGLGTINHTLLTVDAALIRGFDLKGIIFNRAPQTNVSLSEMTNPRVIHELTNVPILGSLPDVEGLSVEGCRFGNLKDVFRERIKLENIFEQIEV